MIVNVSQCASMFDETLHVFKFSAIAKQVKYIVKPPESSMAVKEKKLIPVAHRPSIEWEIKGRFCLIEVIPVFCLFVLLMWHQLYFFFSLKFLWCQLYFIQLACHIYLRLK